MTTADRIWDLLAKKLSGEASVADLEELQQLEISNPDLQASIASLSIIWQQSLPSSHHTTTLEAFQEHISRLKRADQDFVDASTENAYKGKLWFSKKWLIPVMAVAAALTAFLVFQPATTGTGARKPESLSQVSTRPGSRTQIKLPDGSTVWLNASSNITYNEDFGKKLREVNLVGEAYFDVVKDPSRPFIIHTKTIDVKVLGTAFNVKAYPNEANTETSLIRGSVEVTIKNRQNEKLYLKPNEKMVISNVIIPSTFRKNAVATPLIAIQPLNYYPTDSVVTETAWVENVLRFQDESFAEVAMKMERWYGVQIHFKNEKIAAYRMYGSFTKETVTQALDALKISFKFNYEIDGENITITP
jgi:ferric-dicitrate binding protein FerR (iron transport regulator)